MRASFNKLQTNQISQGAGLTQSSGQEKVTIPKRVSNETPLPGRLHWIKLTWAGVYSLMTNPQATFCYIKRIFSGYPAIGTYRVGPPSFGKSECAAMSRLTLMAEGKGEKYRVICLYSKLTLRNILKVYSLANPPCHSGDWYNLLCLDLHMATWPLNLEVTGRDIGQETISVRPFETATVS